MAEETDSQTPTDSPTGLPASAGSAFERCRHTNSIVNHILRSGGSLEDVVVALCDQNDALLKRLIEVESYAPKKIKSDNGKAYVWHCPDDLIPMQNDQSLATAGAGLPKP